MMTDIGTIIWKETRDMLLQRGWRGTLFNWLIMVALVGVFMPLQTGLEWLTAPFLTLLWCWLPCLSVVSLVADAFAGERERHTLETLLASRLPDQAILLGKVLTATIYGWSIQLVGLLLGWITINLSAGAGQLLFYSPLVLWGTVPLVLLLVLLVTGAGVLVSLRSSTVRQAYQKMSIIFLVIAFIPTLVTSLLPSETREVFLSWTLSSPNASLFFLGDGILLVLIVLVLALGLQRFQRSRLVF